MATKKKLLQAAAGSAGGEALNVEDVFSTYLYTGNSTARTITNGIDLSGEGGLVWSKTRNVAVGNALVDTETGPQTYLVSESTAALRTDNYATLGLTAFNSDGYSLGVDTNSDRFNRDTRSYVSWTFRKAPKFFDVVTFTYTGSAQINHNLGCKIGAIIMKRTDAAQDWLGWYYRGPSAGSGYYLSLNTTEANAGGRVDTVHSDTYFDPLYVRGSNSGGTVSPVIGGTYVAYLFAHNDGDGEFGPDGDADIIKCGSYTGTGTAGHFIDLGFEPQWLMIKRSDAAASWEMLDIMRGMPAGGEGSYLRANSANAEATSSAHSVTPSPTGFTIESTSNINGSGDSFIYIAIRRGPMAVPEDATEVFAVDTGSSSDPAFDSGFPVDFAIMTEKNTNTDNDVATRLLQGTGLRTNSTAAEVTGFSNFVFDFMDGWDTASYNTQDISWMWRRAPNFFDVVAYTGTGSNQTINHNLGVAPKFMIVKERTTANNWVCYLEALGNDKRMALNAASAVATDTTAWQSTTPTDNAFYVGANTQTNVSGEKFIAYLFGEVAGISKFGTYTGTGSAQNIDCGFSSGARFVLVKTYAGTNPNANWNIWDSERGIVAGNDPYLALNSTSAEVTSADVIDPYSSGFSLTSSGVANNSGTSYWFYAIA